MSLVVTVPAFLLAAWAFLAFARDRAPDRIQLIGTGVATAAVVLFTILLLGTDGGSSATFIGYTATALVLPAAAWVVAGWEPTRYGSLIIGVAALILPVLALRMGQVWVAS